MLIHSFKIQLVFDIIYFFNYDEKK